MQWRGVPPGDVYPKTDEGWADSRLPVLRGVGLVKSRALAPGSRHQVRVRARLAGCGCGLLNQDRGLSACADKGVCAWTPWSLPSVLTTVLHEGAAPS